MTELRSTVNMSQSARILQHHRY